MTSGVVALAWDASAR